MKKTISCTNFIDRYIKKSELDKPFRLTSHQRQILELAFDFDENGKLPYDTVIYSTVKKSGKTTLNACLTLWWALTQEAPNECLVVANDLDQARARAFASCEGIIQHNPELKAECEVQQKNIYINNGTAITAISSDYQGASGSNHGWVSYEEIWAVTSENGRRLFEELTSVPTRKNSVKFIATYSGFEGESELLMDLYKKAVGRDEHPEGQGERIHPDLPIYRNREARIFAYWDHEPRMPWQTQEYYDSQRKTLRPATFRRLHLNEWVSSENSFIEPSVYDACVEPGGPALEGSLFIGVDASVRRDSTACVAVKYEEDSDSLVLADYKIWRPTPGQPINLEQSVEFWLRRIYNEPRARIEKILYDPYQLARSMQTLTQSGLPCEEYPQTQNNLTEATESLYSALTNRTIRLYHAADLREHVISAVSVETPRGIRLAKQKTSRKIDGAVALSFAVLAAIQAGRPPSLDDYAKSSASQWKPEDNYFDARAADYGLKDYH
jgi:phage terminase large subunit-like protein